MSKHKRSKAVRPRLRLWIVLGVIICLFLIVLFKYGKLETVQNHFLRAQSHQASIHTVTTHDERGVIFDRHHVPLAVSTPLYRLILDPKVLLEYPKALKKLLKSPILADQADSLLAQIEQRPNSRYLLAQKGLTPQQKHELKALGVPGVYLREYGKTFYPEGAALAQLVGFTNFKNRGQDGIELSFNQQLQAIPGKDKVLESAIGQMLDIATVLQKEHPGEDITLSIDSRLQYIAYRALKDEVDKVAALSGSAVVVNPHNGEVLAAVSYPSFNPNNLADRVGPGVRDRAMTDLFEPGSTMKSFTVAAGLDSGKYTPTTPVDTRPGWLVIQGHTIHDDENNGLTDVTGVLKHSSNVGAAKIALSLPWSHTYDLFQSLGFGQSPSNQFPGEATGSFPILSQMSKLEFATLAFGYDISVSSLQLARAYSAIANGGTLYPLTFTKLNKPPQGKRVLSRQTTQELIKMLRTVVEVGGTAIRADIQGYRVVGKTGTTHKVGPHGFEKNKYNAVFAGILPMKNPQLVIVVHINEPTKRVWATQFGGYTASPVFASIAAAAMRIMGVPARP